MTTEPAAYDRLFRSRWADAEEFGAALRTYREAVLAAVPVPPPTDQAALRDRIAKALVDWAYRSTDRKYTALRRDETVRANAYSRADAVLAVLPEVADRAAVLREAADAVAADTGFHIRYGSATDYAEHYAALLRRLAAEAPTATKPDTDLTERLERGRDQLIEAMSAVSEDRTCTGWASDWARTLHAEGGIWETLGRAVGWPTGNYDQWVWVSWDEAAELYAAGVRQDGAQP